MCPNLLDFFFPRTSLSGRDGMVITEAERALLRARQPLVESRAELRARGVRHLSRLHAATLYEGSPLLQQAVRSLKYGRVTELGEDLGQLIAEMVRETKSARGVLIGRPVLCPVPLYWTRRFLRGFNQAELLARVVSRELRLPVEHFLWRMHPTGHQAWRGRAERLRAVRQAFAVRRGATVPRHVILIDDLSTTGATLDACALALKKSGVSRVDGWVLARA